MRAKYVNRPSREEMLKSSWNNNHIDSLRIDNKIRDILNPEVGGDALSGEDFNAVPKLLGNTLLLSLEIVSKLPKNKQAQAQEDLVKPLQDIRDRVVFKEEIAGQKDLKTIEKVLFKCLDYKQDVLGITYEEQDAFQTKEEYHADFFGVHADWLRKDRLARDKKKNETRNLKDTGKKPTTKSTES